VISGMDTIDEISAVKTGRTGMHGDVPLTPVVIESAVRMAEQTLDDTASNPSSEE
jgi:cyclophilin family peptidyl-prolyl cis-trans isomerase